MPLVKVGSKHQVVIPKSVRSKLGIRSGDYVDISCERRRAWIKPKRVVDRDADEPLSPKTRAAIRQALREVAEGKTYGPITSAEELQAFLDSLKR